MFDRRSETTGLRRAARARIINHRRMGRRADTAFGEYATYSPLIRWEPHGYTRDGLPYTATHADIAQRASEYADTARCINTPTPVMAIPLSQTELSRVKEVLLHAPPPQRVLLSITDPDERQRPIQILAGGRLDPPCSDQHGIRCPRRSPMHVDPAPSDACDIHGPTRRVAATFHARRGYPAPNGTRPTVAGHIYITHPTSPRGEPVSRTSMVRHTHAVHGIMIRKTSTSPSGPCLVPATMRMTRYVSIRETISRRCIPDGVRSSSNKLCVR